MFMCSHNRRFRCFYLQNVVLVVRNLPQKEKGISIFTNMVTVTHGRNTSMSVFRINALSNITMVVIYFQHVILCLQPTS